MNPIEKKIEIKGLAINYAEAGSGQAMLFLHNGGGFWHSWEYQVKHFSENYHVFALDWPGFGESDLPDGLISLNLLTETLSEFIQRKDLKNVILVGNCIGGSAALQYNINRPEMVSHLLIFNICPGNLIFRLPPMRRYITYLNTRPKSKLFFGSILVFGFTKTPVKRRFPKMLFGKNADKYSSLYQRYVEKFKLTTQTTSRVNMVFSVHTFNLMNYLPKDHVPRHMLAWGELNSVASLKKHGHYHYDLLQSCSFKVVKNAGHLCMYESPEEVNTLIENYICD